MSLQIEVSKVSAVKSGNLKGVTATYSLRAWLEGATKEVDNPVIDQNFSVYVKAPGGSLTEEIVWQRAEAEVKEKIQECITKFKAEKAALDSTYFDTTVTNLNKEVEG